MVHEQARSSVAIGTIDDHVCREPKLLQLAVDLVTRCGVDVLTMPPSTSEPLSALKFVQLDVGKGNSGRVESLSESLQRAIVTDTIDDDSRHAPHGRQHLATEACPTPLRDERDAQIL